MREPDAYWAHIPAFITALSKVRDYEDWYRLRLIEAVKEVSVADLERLRLIPAQGFYLKILSGTGVKENDLGTGFELVEDLDLVSEPMRVHAPTVLMRLVHHLPSILGTEFNPFDELFLDGTAGLPRRWNAYVGWRRAQRWKPVPEWLSKNSGGRAPHPPDKGHRQ
jgi:hypothetical protein